MSEKSVPPQKDEFVSDENLNENFKKISEIKKSSDPENMTYEEYLKSNTISSNLKNIFIKKDKKTQYISIPKILENTKKEYVPSLSSELEEKLDKKPELITLKNTFPNLFNLSTKPNNPSSENLNNIISLYEKQLSIIKQSTQEKSILKQNEIPFDLDKNHEKYSKIYEDFNKIPNNQFANVNVGEKLGNYLEKTIENRRKFHASFKYGQGRYIYESIKRGRLGVDLYLIIFGMFGIFAIPAYFYKKIQPSRKLMREKKGFSPENFDLETFKGDIDEISVHKNYNTQYKKEIEDYKLKKFIIKKEIKGLENELYGKSH